MVDTTKLDRVVRDPEAKALTGLSRSQRHTLSQKGQFPQKVKLSDRASGYRMSELQEWLASRPRIDAA